MAWSDALNWLAADWRWLWWISITIIPGFVFGLMIGSMKGG